MYKYNSFDHDFIATRNTQFRAQVQRRISGALSEEEFKPLRLMNGLYLQLHAYMLRIAIPYGVLNAKKLRQLAMISERWDKGYGHFTTRQNIQFNWPKLKDVPDILDALAEVEMHAIQTSGNTIRNTTTDHFAGAAADEIEDPRPIAELIRQWSTDHPEFQFLGRKFKIAVGASKHDRAALHTHDLAIELVKNKANKKGFRIYIGGGMGRTPMIAKILNDFLPRADLLPYLEAILSVYNEFGRRDNKYKARIKILVFEKGLEAIREKVDTRFALIKPHFKEGVKKILDAIETHFIPPDYVKASTKNFDDAKAKDLVFRAWCDTNLSEHKNADYACVTLSLKPHGKTPGDASADQMRLIATVAEKYAHDDIRVSHEQNLILPNVHKSFIPSLYQELKPLGLTVANVGLLSDIICCPGMDYCALATARSIPIAQKIATHFKELQTERDIGELKIKISGCINACGHHHVGHIGILGLDRAGVENYQITLGGDASENAKIGERIGPGFSYDEIIPAIKRLIDTYLMVRLSPEERFLQTYQRTGIDIFKKALYPPKKPEIV